MNFFEKSGTRRYLRKAPSIAKPKATTTARLVIAILGEKMQHSLLWKGITIRQAVVDINVDPRFDNIRSDRALPDLLRRTGFPQGR